MRRSVIVVLVYLVVVSGCAKRSDYSEEELARYEQEINAWHSDRLEHVTAKDGWLNLVGLYWLEPGINTFGTGNGNRIVFPDSTLEEQAGYFLVSDGRVDMHLNKQARASINGTPVRVQSVFNADSVRQPQVENGRIAWTIIRRDGKFGVRVRDLTMRGVRNFHGVERFPVDPTYRIDATFVPASGRTIDVTNVIGQTTAQSSPGTLQFSWKGSAYSLDVLEGGEDEYFIIIADETSGKETYAGGRYLYVKHADENNRIVLDFNKAYNPPCVFTPYATCPLPPRQNVLPFSILAGEKFYDHHLAMATRAMVSLSRFATAL